MGALARPTDPDTSHEAAESIRAERGGSRSAILGVLALIGPSTDTALIQAYLNLAELGEVPPQSPSGIRTRRKELTLQGRVADTGDRVPLISGRLSIVWTAVEPGVDW